MTSFAVVIVLGAHSIVALFHIDPTTSLGELSVLWIRLLGYGMPIVGVYITFVGMLQGAGATRTSLGINMVATLAVQIPLSYVLGFTYGLGPLGVWVAFPLGFLVKASLGTVAYKRGGWARVGAE